MSFFSATLISLLGHGVLLFLIISGWHLFKAPEPIKPPNYIKATLITEKSQSKAGVVKPQPPKPEAKPEPKPEPPKPEIDKKQQEIERLQQERLKQKQIALEKAKKEKAKKEKAEKERKRKEKEKREKEKKAKEKKKREEEKRKREQEQQKKKLQDELAREREKLQAELQAELEAQQAEEYGELAQSYVGAIASRIEQNWSRPPSARNGMKAELSISLVPTGKVIDVQVTKSSGNSAFDNSAIQAVKRVDQFEEVKQMSSGLFESQFRRFTLLFQPKDLRQ